MKLYAKMTSERVSRPARKGGNEYIKIFYTVDGGKNEQLINIEKHYIHIVKPDGHTEHIKL